MMAKISRRKIRNKKERKERLTNLQKTANALNKAMGNVNKDLNKAMERTNRSIR